MAINTRPSIPDPRYQTRDTGPGAHQSFFPHDSLVRGSVIQYARPRSPCREPARDFELIFSAARQAGQSAPIGASAGAARHVPPRPVPRAGLHRHPVSAHPAGTIQRSQSTRPAAGMDGSFEHVVSRRRVGGTGGWSRPERERMVVDGGFWGGVGQRLPRAERVQWLSIVVGLILTH